MRLIDADAIFPWYVEAFKGGVEPRIEPHDMRFSMLDIKMNLSNIPTIDAEPVRHGKWIDDGRYDKFFPHHYWRCSECGEYVLEIGVPWFKYCPECGARMDAEEKEE